MLRLLLDHEPGHEVPRSLLWAVYRERSPEVIRMLVAAGADPNAWDEQNERNPYGLAWRMGRPDLCELLAELGARREVGPVDELIGLCFAGDREGALRLAQADPARAERVRDEFFEALHQAAVEGRRAAVEILLELGVAIDRPGQMGGTPLHHAAWWGHDDVVAALLERGADPRRRAEPGIGGSAAGLVRARLVPLPRADRRRRHRPPPDRAAARRRRAPRSSRTWLHAAAPELAEWLAEPDRLRPRCSPRPRAAGSARSSGP